MSRMDERVSSAMERAPPSLPCHDDIYPDGPPRKAGAIPYVTTGNGLSVRGEWQAGYGIVFVSLLGFAVSVIHAVTIGPMIEPVQQSTGWSRSQVTAGMLIISVAAILLTPLLGFMIDRFGVRRIGLCGMALYCTGIASLSLAGTSAWSWAALWAVVGVAEAFINPGLWTVAIAQRFSSSRGLAIALVLCGGGVAMIVWPVLTQALIASHGWRTAYAVIGAGSALVVLPLMFMMFRDVAAPAPSLGDGDGDGPFAIGGRHGQPKGLSVREGLKSSRFYRLALAGFMMNVGLMALFVHFVPVSAATSIPRASAIALVGVIGAFSIVGRLTSGFLIDRFDGRLIGAISSAIPIAAAVLLYAGDGANAAVIAAIFIGLSFGAEIDVIAYLASRYLGLRNFGALYGFIVSGLVFGSGVGPALASFCHDQFGNYDAFLLTSIALFAISSAFLASLGRYPNFQDHAS